MRLKVLLPTEILLDEAVTRVMARAENGAFCLLPRHIDFVTALVPGILVFTKESGEEIYVAVDEGILVKCGRDVRVSTPHALLGTELGRLEEALDEQFRKLDERERAVHAAVARLEADLVRRFMEVN